MGKFIGGSLIGLLVGFVLTALVGVTIHPVPLHAPHKPLGATISLSVAVATLKPEIVQYEAIVTAYCPCELFTGRAETSDNDKGSK